jgi:hypothetical protein
MFEQERMIGRIQRRVMDAPEIFACFLSGSFGRRSDDEYSDLDVALVYRDESRMNRAWKNRVQFSKSIMPYVSLKSFDAVHIRPYFHIVLFANGSKLDLRFETKETLSPNPADGQLRILKDSDGWAENYRLESSRLAYPKPGISSQELREIDQRFWVIYWDVLRLLVRGDAVKSFPIYLELLHFTFPPLLTALPEGTAAANELICVQFGRDTKTTAKNMKDMLEGYKSVRKLLVENYHLQFSANQSFEDQIERLMERVI